MAFVIDGWALEIALKHHRKDFVELAILSRTAICCRVTPSQKAQVLHPTLGAIGSLYIYLWSQFILFPRGHSAVLIILFDVLIELFFLTL